jgi:hypothetical protein
VDHGAGGAGPPEDAGSGFGVYFGKGKNDNKLIREKLFDITTFILSLHHEGAENNGFPALLPGIYANVGCGRAKENTLRARYVGDTGTDKHEICEVHSRRYL